MGRAPLDAPRARWYAGGGPGGGKLRLGAAPGPEPWNGDNPMFDKLKSKASKASKRNTSKPKQELTRTTEFVTCLVKEKLRITYAALAHAAADLGEHTPSGLSAGQRGSALVRSLPIELQPHVCRGNGSYAKGTEWDTDVPDDLRSRGYVRPEAILAYVEAFEEATSETAEPEIITEDDSEDEPSIDDEIDALDAAHDDALDNEVNPA